jgi:hypothetical protein
MTRARFPRGSLSIPQTDRGIEPRHVVTLAMSIYRYLS